MGLAIVFVFGAVVALAFAFNDLCDGFQTNRGLAVVVAAACIGGLVGTVVAGGAKRRPAVPWVVVLLVAVVVFFGLYVRGLLVWVGECSR